jgi:hypothetical protein
LRLTFSAFQVIALYLLGVLELISLSLCPAIAIRIPGQLQFINNFVVRRNYAPQVLSAQRSTIYAAIVSAGYAVFFYGILSCVLWRNEHSYFGGVSIGSTQIYIFGQFIQSSFLTITSAGPVLVIQRFTPELIGDIERVTGIFFFVYLLSVLASGWAERALSRSRSGERPEPGEPPRQDSTPLSIRVEAGFGLSPLQNGLQVKPRWGPSLNVLFGMSEHGNPIATPARRRR